MEGTALPKEKRQEKAYWVHLTAFFIIQHQDPHKLCVLRLLNPLPFSISES